MLDLAPHIVNGLMLGLLFALIALGFTLIVGLMEQINLAHGSLFALGAYVALQLLGPNPPLPPELAARWLALPALPRYAIVLVLAPCLTGLVGVAVELCMRRTYGKDPLFGLLLTFGAAMVIEEGIRQVWGTRDHVLPVPKELTGAFLFQDLIWSTYRFYAAGIAIVAIGLTWLLIERTRYGAIIKAGAHDSEMVMALGIDLPRMRSLVFALGTAMAGVAGVIAAPMWSLKPTIGAEAVMPAFIVVVIGGIGSFWGAVVGGLMLGVASGLSNLVVPRGSILVMYLLMTVILLWRPRGLMGQKSILEL